MGFKITRSCQQPNPRAQSNEKDSSPQSRRQASISGSTSSSGQNLRQLLRVCRRIVVQRSRSTTPVNYPDTISPSGGLSILRFGLLRASKSLSNLVVAHFSTTVIATSSLTAASISKRLLSSLLVWTLLPGSKTRSSVRRCSILGRSSHTVLHLLKSQVSL